MDSILLEFEEFQEVNENELNCIFAESGADREMDFDRETQEEKIYYQYRDYYKSNFNLIFTKEK